MMISYCWNSETKINILASGHSDGRFGAIVGNILNLIIFPPHQMKNQYHLKPVFTLLKNSQCI